MTEFSYGLIIGVLLGLLGGGGIGAVMMAVFAAGAYAERQCEKKEEQPNVIN